MPRTVRAAIVDEWAPMGMKGSCCPVEVERVADSLEYDFVEVARLQGREVGTALGCRTVRRCWAVDHLHGRT
jgi:hypothetical protein